MRWIVPSRSVCARAMTSSKRALLNSSHGTPGPNSLPARSRSRIRHLQVRDVGLARKPLWRDSPHHVRDIGIDACRDAVCVWNGVREWSGLSRRMTCTSSCTSTHLVRLPGLLAGEVDRATVRQAGVGADGRALRPARPRGCDQRGHGRSARAAARAEVDDGAVRAGGGAARGPARPPAAASYRPAGHGSGADPLMSPGLPGAHLMPDGGCRLRVRAHRGRSGWAHSHRADARQVVLDRPECRAR